jgi:cytochrome c oxidase cbb3-type subunit 4
MTLTYEDVRAVTAMLGLLLFVGLFAGVLIYVFWPGNRARFHHASSVPLEKDPDDMTSGVGNG